MITLEEYNKWILDYYEESFKYVGLFNGEHLWVDYEDDDYPYLIVADSEFQLYYKPSDVTGTWFWNPSQVDNLKDLYEALLREEIKRML